jgi:sugar phosphate isomerase/epimerase
MTDRRDFLKMLGATAAAGALWPSRAAADDQLVSSAASIRRIGVQLYTVRGAMEKDGVDATLAKLAGLGFKEVEFAGYFGRTAAQVKDALRANGLRSPSTHATLDIIGGPNFPKFVENAAAIGHKWIVLSWLAPADRGGVEKYTEHAATVLKAQEIASKAGITMAYHNHDFEFDPIGTTDGYEVLLEKFKGSGVQMEMDLYWTTKAGKDPLSYWRRFPGQFPMVHVKDSAGAPAHEMRSVGAGSINWANLFAERRVGGVQHFYVEHDNPTDPWQSVTDSCNYLKRLRFR